jgi:hypothetical protein
MKLSLIKSQSNGLFQTIKYINNNIIKLSYSSNANIAHTIQVKQDIDNKRKNSLLGGGIHRIDAQHRKVFLFRYITLFNIISN